MKEFGLGLVGGCCGTTPGAPQGRRRSHRRHARARPRRSRRIRASRASTSTSAFNQDASYLAIGERTNANGSLAFREAMLEERWDDCVDIARSQVREGAHLLDVCVDYVGPRRGRRHAGGRLAARERVDAAARRRLHRARRPAGRHGADRRAPGGQLGELRRRRRARVAVRPHHAARQGARRRRDRPHHRRGGPGPHRREQGADRLPARRHPGRTTGACGSTTSSSTR